MTDFRAIWDEANKAGVAAAQACKPIPMTVYEDRPGGQSWHVPDGVCGFAWIAFKGNTPWARWAKKNAGATKNYPSGLHIWVSDFGQSMARKEAYARAFAKVLNENGIEAYADSRMD